MLSEKSVPSKFAPLKLIFRKRKRFNGLNAKFSFLYPKFWRLTAAKCFSLKAVAPFIVAFSQFTKSKFDPVKITPFKVVLLKELLLKSLCVKFIFSINEPTKSDSCRFKFDH